MVSSISLPNVNFFCYRITNRTAYNLKFKTNPTNKKAKQKQVQECHRLKQIPSILLSSMIRLQLGYRIDFSRNKNKVWVLVRVKFKTDGGPKSDSCKMARGDENSCKE